MNWTLSLFNPKKRNALMKLENIIILAIWKLNLAAKIQCEIKCTNVENLTRAYSFRANPKPSFNGKSSFVLYYFNQKHWKLKTVNELQYSKMLYAAGSQFIPVQWIYFECIVCTIHKFTQLTTQRDYKLIISEPLLDTFHSVYAVSIRCPVSILGWTECISNNLCLLQNVRENGK